MKKKGKTEQLYRMLEETARENRGGRKYENQTNHEKKYQRKEEQNQTPSGKWEETSQAEKAQATT